MMLYELLPKKDEKWEAIAEELHKALQYKKMYEQMVAELSDKLKNLSNNESSRGKDFVYICSYRKGTIDFMAIPGIDKLGIEKYRKDDITTWKLTKI
jgi:hypothetical protein